MAGNERFDDSIGKWLQETAPNRLPQRVLAATFERTRRTRQDHAWRAVLGRLQMPRFIPALGGAAIVVMAAVFALNVIPLLGPGGPPTPTPTASSSTAGSASVSPPPPLTERFNSTSHRISMGYPAGWQTRPATAPWTDGVINFAATGVDIIFDPTRGDHLYFAVASEPLNGRPDEVWGADVTGPACPGGHGGGVLEFDGASGWVVTCGGSPVGVHSALLTDDTYGYAIFLYLGDEGLIDTYTSAWFVSVLETLDLRAAGEPNASNPSESP